VISLIYFFHSFDTLVLSEYIDLLFYIFALFFISLFGYWLNDSFDIVLDRLAGKKNFLANTSAYFRLIGTFLLLVFALLFWYLTQPSLIATLFFLIEIILFTAYCLPGIRFKNHPIIGPLTDAHYTHIVPMLFTLFLFAKNVFVLWLIPIYFLLLAKGMRNILLHQLNDRKGDCKMQLNSFPLFFGPRFTVNFINRIFIPFEIILITTITLLLLHKSVLPIIFWLVFLAVYFLFFSGWHIHYMNSRYFMFKFHYFINDFYEFWIPFLAIWAATHPLKTKIILSLIHLLVFNQTILYFKKLFGKIYSNLNEIKIN
jgi:4-hydroxybenzoate polyprenyltransferase